MTTFKQSNKHLGYLITEVPSRKWVCMYVFMYLCMMCVVCVCVFGNNTRTLLSEAFQCTVQCNSLPSVAAALCSRVTSPHTHSPL